MRSNSAPGCRDARLTQRPNVVLRSFPVGNPVVELPAKVGTPRIEVIAFSVS